MGVFIEMLRRLVYTIFESLYRVEAVGRERLPREGGAVLVANHQSYLDALLVMWLAGRPVRFLVAASIMQRWWVWPFAKLTRAIPIERHQGPRALLKALQEARDEVARGGLVGVFPEGAVTRTGTLLPFLRGYEKILQGTDAPLIPVAIDGTAETAWGRLDGAGPSLRPPRRGWKTPLRVAVGEPLPPDLRPPELRQEIAELLIEAFELRRREERPLHALAIARLRRQPLARLTGDHASHGPVPNFRLLAGLVALGEKLAPHYRDDEAIGVMLPPTLGGMLTNMALAAAGRVSVNLNYTSSARILDEIREEAGVRLLITSRVFLEKANVALPEGLELLYLEDVRHTIGRLDQLKALAIGLFASVETIEERLGRTTPASLDETAGLLYSSGSTGRPKGIPLTHWNMVANVRAALLAIRLPEHARLLGALPFFHSFGFNVGLWLPLLGGIGIAFHPSPLDARGVAESIRTNRVTHLFATPSFLGQYLRRVDPGDFATLEYVVTGAEKLRDSIADAFEERFGIRPVEGYGCTELAPIVALSANDARGPGGFQRAHKPGAVGVPMLGVAVRFADPETGERVPIGKTGALLVAGPNVMGGYYERPDLTEPVLKDGWYSTGDLAHLDKDGFLHITDRLSRFSKIAGEMVPHGRIEEALQAAAGESDPCFAVTGLPDDRRGERLIVLTTLPLERARRALEALTDEIFDLPGLWIPRERDLLPVEEIPVLGTGKKDLQRIRQLALDAQAQQ
ncbi:MAG: acyl-[acyl-carrier-protein]-phospholipid O-acyltransferase [Candidatus Sumerlaeota bacterium]|nr:acyl-[acyl-carrier-protein]-phospholipid O-acyltransferase [Candidatus Sumerlaeota bacterium]